MGRPKYKVWKGFVGQERVVNSLQDMTENANRRQRPLTHILFAGPPGMGKSDLAVATAEAMGVTVHRVFAQIVDRKGVLELLADIGTRDIIYIDEAHDLPRKVCMLLNQALDKGVIPDPATKGSTTKKIEPFTLILATNEPGRLPKPLRDRMHRLDLDSYTVDELKEIALRVAEAEGVEITPQARQVLAERALGCPRVVKNFVRAMLDEMGGVAEYTQPFVERFLRDRLAIDELGLTRDHRRFLETLVDGPRSLQAISNLMRTDFKTVAFELQPDLVRTRLVEPMRRGQVLTPEGRAHLARVRGGGR